MNSALSLIDAAQRGAQLTPNELRLVRVVLEAAAQDVAKLARAKLAYMRLQTQREREAVEIAEERRAASGRIKKLKQWHAEAEARAAELFDAIISGEIEL